VIGWMVVVDHFEVGLLVRTSQAWKTFLSPGCIKEDSWRFLSSISFLYSSLYHINSLNQKTHFHTQKGLKENLLVSNIILKKFLILHFSPLKKFSKNFLKKTKPSLPPPNDLQQPFNQSQSIKSKTRQTRPSLININNTTLNNNPNPINFQENMLLILPYILKSSLAIQKDWCDITDANLRRNGTTSVARPKGLLYIKISLLHMSLLINNVYTICRTISHIWKTDVFIPFMSLEANLYIWLRRLHMIGQNPE